MHRNGFLASASAPLLTLSLPPWWGTSLKTHNVINTIGIKCQEILNATNWPFLKRVLPEEKNISMIAISFSSSPTYDVGLVTKFEIGINWLGHREVVLSSATRHWSRNLIVDSNAVSLFTNSETAATTLWERLQNFQRSLNQWRDVWTGCFLID